jgi:thiol-disulfide isomerase/thioredoxin
MKSLLLTILVATVLFSCSVQKKAMKINYTVVPDGQTKVLRGIINRKIIETDTAFKWFADNMKWGKTDEAAVQSFINNKDKFSLIVFGGTWCHDTQNLLPIFYRLIDKSNYPDKKITLIAVDRPKTTINNLHTQYKITNVPTFIVLDNAGKEVGRVTEYGTKGAIDKELGEIVATIQ